MSRAVPRERWLKYIEFRENGMTRDKAAELAVIDFAAASAFDRGEPKSSGHKVWLERCEGKALWEGWLREHIHAITGATGVSDKIDVEVRTFKQARDVARVSQPLSHAARHALNDPTGEAFRRRYFGRVVPPWQKRAWSVARELRDDGRMTGDRKYLLLNCPPGVGKTTIHQDWAAWEIAADRAVRMGMFSIAAKVAIGNCARVRDHLQRPNPIRATENDMRRGTAVDAIATLTADFGAFKPLVRDLWTREAFNVVQLDGESTDDKEPTLAAWGFDMAYIGQRLVVMLADDMVDKKVTRNPEIMANQRRVWDEECETRLEPGGFLWMAGQKLSPDDLYAYVEKQTIPVIDDDDDIVVLDGAAEPKRYFHLKFAAHDDDNCQGIHNRAKALPQPDGCLLDPKRLPWRELATIRRNKPATYAVVFQQSDSAPGDNLVEPIWIDGGVDHDGTIYLGCWDDDRRVWEAPKVERFDGIGIVTVDPSSTKYWAVQAWWYQQPHTPDAQATYAGRRYLLGIENAKLDAPSLLGMNVDTREFYGTLETFRQNYLAAGLRLDNVIIEANHAQRFLLQLKETHRWSEVYGITLHAHQTGADKWDEDIGVTILKDHWRHGRVRLPGKTDMDKAHVKSLTQQVVAWGRQTLNDQVMANWFLEKRLPMLPVPDRYGSEPTEHRPSWLTKKRSVGARRT